ncbi:MAG: hypothetical protein D6722_09635 [Bacteroidetes bacterium]|nr:MAG: hypothetical protein D6722_09635 [Bacteroidota bacterium]
MPASDLHAPLVLTGFLAFLRAEGLEIRPEAEQKALRLLAEVGPGVSAERLKAYLAPLLAPGRAQQKRFYLLFDRFLAQEAAKQPPQPAAEGEPWPFRLLAHRRYYFLLLSLLLVAACLIGIRTTDCYLATRSLPATYTCMLDLSGSLPGVVHLPPPGEKLDPPPPAPDSLRRAFSMPLPLEGPFEVDISDLRASWRQRYRPLLKALAILLLLMGYLFYELYRSFRRKWFRLRSRRRFPPYLWHIQSQEPSTLTTAPDLYQAGQRLRQMPGASLVSAKAQPATDLPSPQVAPRYLVLVEQRSPRDHLARYVNLQIEQLQDQGLIIERFYFGQNPRSCWQEPEGEEVSLETLVARFADWHPVVVAESEVFFDPVHGAWEPWVNQLATWPEVVVMSPENPLQWGSQVQQLAARFLFVPATLEALAAWPQWWGRAERPSLADWQSQNVYPPLPDLDGSEPRSALRAYFDTRYDGGHAQYRRGQGRHLYQWLCSCAIYPTLSWDLTLALGQALEQRHRTSLTQPEQMFQLFALPWFREGEIPPPLRAALIRELPREVEQEARRTIVRILRDNPPPTGSFAEPHHKLLLAAQEAQLYADLGHNIRLIRRAQDFSLHDEMPDFTVTDYLRYLPRHYTRISLPATLSRWLFREGIGPLGLRSWVRATLVVGAIMLIFSTFSVAWQSQLQTFAGETYQVRTATDHARYFLYVGNRYAAAGEKAAAAAAYEAALKPGWESEVAIQAAYNRIFLETRGREPEKGIAALRALQDSLLAQGAVSSAVYRRAAYHRGVLLYEAGQPAEAAAVFAEAVEAAPGDLSARWAEGVARSQVLLSGEGGLESWQALATKLEAIQGQDPAFLPAQPQGLALLSRLTRQAPDAEVQQRLRQLGQGGQGYRDG